MKQILILLAMLGFLALAAAQTIGPEKPVANADYRSNCFIAAVKMYRTSADTNQELAEMQKEVLAAQSLERLDAMNQDC